MDSAAAAVVSTAAAPWVLLPAEMLFVHGLMTGSENSTRPRSREPPAIRISVTSTCVSTPAEVQASYPRLREDACC